MGYTVATPAKSKKAKKEMLAFMDQYFRPGYEAFGYEKGYDPSRNGVLSSEDLAYDDGTSKMGFNYNGELGRDYIFNVCSWMALKVGRKRKFKSYGIIESVPYYVYDGYESVPVLLKSEWEGIVTCTGLFTGPLGSKEGPQHRSLERSITERGHSPDLENMLEEEKENFAMIKKELQRLDDLWSSR